MRVLTLHEPTELLLIASAVHNLSIACMCCYTFTPVKDFKFLFVVCSIIIVFHVICIQVDYY